MDIILKYFPDLTKKQIQQFASLQDLYNEWNEKINVISRKDMDNFYEHHVLHSLAIAKLFSFSDGYNVMDLGSGGGFPGIPLAIFFPLIHFNLVDSINKKLKVVNEIASAINLTNINTQHIRAEEIKNKKFDIVLSRAVAPLKDLWYWTKPLLKKKPIDQPDKLTGLVCLKGGDLSKEIADIALKPKIYEIDKLFEEDFYKEKYVLFVQL